jgi:hypothetical protein
VDDDDAPSVGSPLFIEADTDEEISCFAIHPGRHLQIFTSSGEFYIPSEPITTENIALKITSRIGAKPGLPVVDVEGGSFFISRSGQGLMEYLFVDTEQSYLSTEVSLLSGHLVHTPSDVAIQRAIDNRNPAIYYLANTGTQEDGAPVPAAMVSVLRAQQVTSFSRWTSPGATIKSVGATQFGDVVAVVHRWIGSNLTAMIEMFTDGAQLDGGAIVYNPNVDIHAATGAGPYGYTFSAASSADVVVYVRPFGTGIWQKQTLTTDYTLNLGASSVTLTTAQYGGEVRISKPMTSVTLPYETAHLDGVTLRLVSDGDDIGTVIPIAQVIQHPQMTADFSVEYGFHFEAQSQPMPFRRETSEGRPLALKSRIPNVAVSLYRSSTLSVGPIGGTIKPLDLGLPTTGTKDARLATGQFRRWGMKGWAIDNTIHIRRDKAEPMHVRSAVYDQRW